MQTYDWFGNGKSAITYQAFEKFFKGEGNPRAATIAVSTIEELTDSGACNKYLRYCKEGISGLLNHGATVFLYSNDTFLANHIRKANPDALLLKFDGTHLHYVFLRPANDSVSLKGSVSWDGENDIVKILTLELSSNDFSHITLQNDTNIGYFGVLPDKYIVPENEYEYPEGWSYLDSGPLENKFDKPAKVVNTNNVPSQTQIKNSTGEVKMSKVNNVVAANKSAAVSVAKIEAGRIAVKQAVKLVKPAVPMMARGYLETALGELVVANLFKFAVDNFAANNDKAQVVADAMLQGAMLGAIQSLNIEQMISDVLEKVDISKFTDIAKSDE